MSWTDLPDFTELLLRLGCAREQIRDARHKPEKIDGFIPTAPGKKMCIRDRPKETCLSCHGSYDKLAERTAKLTPNPHFSHRGEEDCTNCHSLHGKSRLECNDCHSFNLNFKW